MKISFTNNNLLTAILIMGGSIFILSGCATISRPTIDNVRSVESINDQLDAAQKVLGAMANTELNRKELIDVARDLENDEEAKDAAQKILGGRSAPVIKYSPVTGKHYSGDLEFDPDTGVKLLVVED